LSTLSASEGIAAKQGWRKFSFRVLQANKGHNVREKVDSMLSWLGIEPRAFRALLRVFFLNDLRGQHYTKATGTKSHHVVSPLFWVVGQCLTLSSASSFFLFMRCDVFFFAFVGLVVSNLVLATTILVEFNEIVIDPRDLDVIGHRPVPPRTYAAARYANLLFFVGLMYVALNLFPLALGAGLRDAGPWYAPAYFVASLSSNLIVATLVIFFLSIRSGSAGLEQVKEIVAWTQIILILVAVYGGQMMLRDPNGRVLVWGAFPPAWTAYLPITWLARFVEHAAVYEETQLWGWAGLMLGLMLAGCVLCLVRLTQLYRTMQPLAVKGRVIVRPVGQMGSLAGAWTGWLLSGPEERVGFWLCRTLLIREPGLLFQSLFSFYLVVAIFIVGVGTAKFANPLVERSQELIVSPIFALFSIALGVPPMLRQLTVSRDYQASWIYHVAPLRQPAGLLRGLAKGAMLMVVTPLCVAFGVAVAILWNDPLSGLLHAALAWLLSWGMALAALAFILRDPPFSTPFIRGGTLGPIAVPLALMFVVLSPLAGLHVLFADQLAYWFGAAIGCVVAIVALNRIVDAKWATAGRFGG
jgi:hypothetical protein